MQYLLFFNYLVFVVLYKVQHINFTALSILFIINTFVLVLFFLKKNNQNESNFKKKILIRKLFHQNPMHLKILRIS